MRSHEARVILALVQLRPRTAPLAVAQRVGGPLPLAPPLLCTLLLGVPPPIIVKDRPRVDAPRVLLHPTLAQGRAGRQLRRQLEERGWHRTARQGQRGRRWRLRLLQTLRHTPRARRRLGAGGVARLEGGLVRCGRHRGRRRRRPPGRGGGDLRCGCGLGCGWWAGVACLGTIACLGEHQPEAAAKRLLDTIEGTGEALAEDRQRGRQRGR